MRRALLFCSSAAMTTLALASACSGPPPVRPILTPPASDVETAPAYTSPARWVYFPRDVSVPSATLVLPDKTCLVTTMSGDRWLLHGPEDKPCSGQGTASASPIFEPLAGIVASASAAGDGAEYRFVSASGRIFTAADPLAPFMKFTKVDRPFVQVASSKGEIIGVDGAGIVSYFDATSSTWKRAQQPPGSRVLRLGMDDAGRALAITLPEGVLTSSDAGKTFTAFASTDAAAPPRIGATDVLRTSAGELALDGALGKLVWLRSGAFQRSTEELTAAGPVEATIERSSTPVAGTLREQRGVVSEDRYHDLRYPDAWMVLPDATDEDTSPYVLTRGPISGPLEFVRLHGLTGCIDLRLGARGKNVAIACSHATDSSNLGVTLFSSADDGDTFKVVAEFNAQNFSDVSLDVGADGSILVMNVCRTDVQKKKKAEEEGVEEQCRPRAPVYVRSKGEESTLVQGSVPRQTRPGFSPLVGIDNHLYYIGHRPRDERAVIMVSTDAGKSWEERPVELPEAADDAASDPLAYAYGSLDLSPEYARLTMDETGTIGVVGQTNSGLAWVTADADGHVSGVAMPPESGNVGGVGRRMLAVSYGNGDGVTRAWESVDGGASFSEIATTGAIAGFFNSGDGSIACAASGCILGDTLARVGWEGQAESQMNIIDVAVPMADAHPGPGMTCELTPKTEWTPVKNIAIGTIHPRLRELMRGKSAWSLLTQDPVTHELDATSASMPDKESEPSVVQQRALLGAFGNGKVGFAANWQSEGYVSARANYAEKDGVLDTKPLSVEVAWANYYLGTFGRRTITDVPNGAGTFLQLTGGPIAVMSPALLSIAGTGVALRSEWGTTATTFVDAGARTTKFDQVDWNELGISGGIDGDVAMVGGELFSVGFVSRANGNAFAIGRASGGSVSVDATTLSDGFAQTDWTYFDGQSGISVINQGVDGDPATAFFVPLRADGSVGDPVPLPTLSDLGDRPRGCSADDRKNTPRAYMPVFSRNTRSTLFPNGRRPVLVTEGTKDAKSLGLAGPTWFLTDGAILHGTPKDPCVAAFRGSAVGQSRVVVIAGDLQHAWMFRPAPPTSGCLCDPNDEACDCSDPANQVKHDKNQVVASVEWRPMTCQYKPELAPPAEIAAEITYPAPEDIP